MNKLSNKKRVQIVAALVEGNSIRPTCRMTATAKGTDRAQPLKKLITSSEIGLARNKHPGGG